jgi:hypothetical protein
MQRLSTPAASSAVPRLSSRLTTAPVHASSLQRRAGARLRQPRGPAQLLQQQHRSSRQRLQVRANYDNFSKE